MTIHYTGAGSVNRTPEQTATYLKAIERHQMANPNMAAVGYNFFISKDGRIWEGRGWIYRNAANGTTSNLSSFSVCLLLGVEDNTPTPEMVRSLQGLYAAAKSRFGRALVVKGHQEHKATACPGREVMVLIRSGQIQQPTPAPTPTPTHSTYRVVRGDSYWSTAAKLLGSGTRWREISDLNGGRALHPGLLIKVPVQ